MLLGCLTTTGLSIPAFKPITSLSGALCPINTAHSPQMQTLLFSAAPGLASKFNLSKILFFFSCLVICIVNPCLVKVFHINASHCFSTEVSDRVLKWVIIHQTGPNIVSHTSDLKIWILEQVTGFFFWTLKRMFYKITLFLQANVWGKLWWKTVFSKTDLIFSFVRSLTRFWLTGKQWHPA